MVPPRLKSGRSETFGVSVPSARSYSQVAEKCHELPNLMGSLSRGRDLLRQGAHRRRCGHAQTDRGTVCPSQRAQCPRAGRGGPDHGRPGPVRFGLPVSLRARRPLPALQRRAPHLDGPVAQRGLRPDQGLCRCLCAGVSKAAGASDGDGEARPLDQRRCDGFMAMVDSVHRHRLVRPGRPQAASTTATHHSPPNPFFVVAHVPLKDLVDEAGDKSELAAELEHHGLIDLETVQRIACDATVVVAVDDAAGPHHVRGPGPALRRPGPSDAR